MNIHHSDPVTWLNKLWQVIGEWEDKVQASPCEAWERTEEIDDVKTVMAWIAGALGYDINHDGDYVLEEEMMDD